MKNHLFTKMKTKYQEQHNELVKQFMYKYQQ